MVLKSGGSSFLICSLFVFLLTQSCALWPVTPISGKTSSFTVVSESGNPYLIQVWIPELPPTSTVYALDGDEVFLRLAALSEELNRRSIISPMAVVAIGYGNESNNRTRDYTPTTLDGEGGGLERFWDFLEMELVPLVETRYDLPQVPEKRVVTGHSFGGLAVLGGLVRDKGVFGRFHISSPSLWWDGNWMFTPLQVRLTQGFTHTSIIWASVGGIEGGAMNALFKALQTMVESKNDPFMTHQFTVFPDLKHYEVSWVSRRQAFTDWGKF